MNVLPTEGDRFRTNTGHAILRAAKLLGWTHIAVVKFEGSEDDAAAYRVADNMLGRLSTMNPIKVGKTAVKLESRVPGFDASNLGMEPQKLKKITEALKASPKGPTEPPGGYGAGGGPSKPDGGEGGEENGKGKEPTLRYEFFFESEEEREKWFSLLRELRSRFPELTNPASFVIKSFEGGPPPTGDVVEISEGRVGDGYYVLAFENKGEADEFEQMADWVKRYYEIESPTKAILALFREATSGAENGAEEEPGTEEGKEKTDGEGS
jgi:hypothetical protein